MLQNGVSRAFMQRLPLYLNYLKSLDLDEEKYISATKISHALDLGEVQVRKDLACVSKSGKPKVGYEISCLIGELESFLGCDSLTKVVVVGAGKLGKALLGFDGFEKRGIEIVAAFDNNQDNLGSFEGKPVLSTDEMKDYCEKNDIHVAILTVSNDVAQEVFDNLISFGITKVWNFTTVRLVVPKNVFVQNEDMVNSLAILIKNVN